MGLSPVRHVAAGLQVMTPTTTTMKTNNDENDEPLVVLVLHVMAGLALAVALGAAAMGPQERLAAGLMQGATAGAVLWGLAVIIRLLHRIEKNTR